MSRKVLVLIAFAALVGVILNIPSLVGTTYASAENQVTTTGAAFWLMQGLDQPVEISDGSNQPIFAYNLWEPGYTQLEYFTLECDQAADFQFSFQLTTDPAHLTALANAIDVYYKVTEGSLGTDRNTVLTSMTYAGTLTEVLSQPQLFSSTGSGSVTFAIALQMKQSAGNEYQGLTLFQNTAQPYFNIKVTASTNLP